MKITVIGNCQIGPLRRILEVMLKDATLPTLPAVHTIQPGHNAILEDAFSGSDFIIGQQVFDTYPVESVRTSKLRDRFGDKLITWPNLYFSGYAPEYGVIHNAEYLNFRGPLYDYHSEKILLSFLNGKTAKETLQLIENPSDLDSAWYGTAIQYGLKVLRDREETSDIVISDYIEKNFKTSRLFYVMNHPSVHLLIELAVRILDHIGIKPIRRAFGWMLADFELSYTLYPENPFIRDHWKLEFPPTPYARGGKMVPASNTLGVTTGTPALFSPAELVEEFFNFYAPHEAALRATPRVKALLDRQPSFQSLL
jgi:hypothetical protein